MQSNSSAQSIVAPPPAPRPAETAAPVATASEQKQIRDAMCAVIVRGDRARTSLPERVGRRSHPSLSGVRPAEGGCRQAEGEGLMTARDLPQITGLGELLATGRFFIGPQSDVASVERAPASQTLPKICISCGARQSHDGSLPCGHDL
ncbi:hypothetical protein B0G84_5014 [Paraburkholderia sp. BL8N3]|nr:hypothetical protein [Paraburkholderia sp. BL8N3]TCK39674.1 hypothetical protein B0G84_5014 [Paraburkholderia sp. BL8N3]